MKGTWRRDVILLSRRRDRIMVGVLTGSAVLAVGVLVIIVGYVLWQGLPVLTPTFLLEAPEKMGRAGGIFPTIVGTVVLTAGAVLVAAPLGVATAIYLAEYAHQGRTVALIRFGTESLAGIPSIIFGVFGFLFFVIYLDMGWSILSGALTLAGMILPTIIRTAEEAMLAVPREYREVSYSLGGSRWQTITRVVLPNALPGILTGIMLGVGRSVGETAAVIFTAGASLRVPHSLFDPVRTMSVHFYLLAREGISMRNAYGTAAVLVLSVLAVNFVAYYLMHRHLARLRGAGR
ncbi:MAG: phosphate ABC transporter permease PstA [Firmicutes bacterium]|nr:phosphate ABC transporter permease PstA [Bacillota bacterium]MDI6825237.1 phosphate ABC transporter permease PstA [Bacillota bacterium]MDI7250174.1 phosphate ABC transporter permease PstA [Bacillota bacterium]